MLRQYLDGMQDINFYAIFSLLVFFLFFSFITFWMIKADRKHMQAMSCMPLEENESTNLP